MTRKCMPPKSFKRQEGWTFWTLLFTLSVLVFFAYIGMQLVPLYSTNENVKNAMVLSIDDVDLLKVTRASVIKSLNAQLYLDGSIELLDYKNDLVVRRSKQLVTVEVHYQREVHLFYNIHLLMKFDNIVERELNSN